MLHTRWRGPREFQKHVFQIGLAIDGLDRRGRPLRHDPAPLEKDDPVRHLLHLPHVVRGIEHTSELQSQSNLVCRLLLEKKKKKKKKSKYIYINASNKLNQQLG